MSIRILLFALLTSVAGLASAASASADATASVPGAQGLNVTQSPYSVAKTVQRFENVVENNGLTVFDTIDHSAGARSAGLRLAPTTLVIFGNPKAGTPLMQCARTVGIDLPSKALVWRENNQTWIGVNDMAYLAQRHDMTDCPAVPKVADKIAHLVEQTVYK